jgi:NAD(P)-dependent dehydrogenase (short-subunit alcohol dehydrogenase family)
VDHHDTGSRTTPDVTTGRGLLAGRVALVTGGGTGSGREVALGLADAGAAVAPVGPTGREPSVADTIQAGGGRAAAVTARLDDPVDAHAAFAAAADALGPIGIVVHALAPPGSYDLVELADTTDAGWDIRCEAVLRSALACAAATYRQLSERGGRLLLLTPTVTLTGAAGLVPIVTALEGLRALAKSAARQWGPAGITVNCVAPSLGLVAPASGRADPGVEAPALGRAPDGRADLAPVVALLASDAARFVTGATIVVDGGVVMTP